MIRFLVAAVVGLAPSLALACGCFAAPDPTVPVVQAGERIIFAVKNGEVTAHVQVLYDGSSGQPFGWLVPLPAVPALSVGTDELFAQLTRATQPLYRVNRNFSGACTSAPFASAGGGGGAAGFGSVDAGSASPLVAREVVGPYDSAVLRGDSKQAMLQWLADNRFFVPSTSDAALAPYINPGSYFLALKLRPGAGTGDLQPIVMKYQSDVGQIPLTLTSIGAVQNMGVQVFMLGEGRAIPRNYHHTVINDALIDWLGGARNYNDVIIRAVGEAPGKHSFVTEYAGPTSIVTSSFPQTNRFGDKATLAAQPDAAAFVQYLFSNGFQSIDFSGQPSLPSPLLAVLQRYLPAPANVQPGVFYSNYASFVASAPAQNYQPVAMADEIWQRVVVPAQEARALLERHPTLTRLYTTISPADMNKDPAFSFNASLAPVNNVHVATFLQRCDGEGRPSQGGTLTTEQGWVLDVPDGARPNLGSEPLPASLRIEVLAEEGLGTVLTDNSRLLEALPPVPLPDMAVPKKAGCQVVDGGILLGLAALAWSRRRR